MTQPNDTAVWIILGIIIGFTALVGFLIAYRRRGGGASAIDKVFWWPDKFLRLFWILSPFILCVVCALYFGSLGKETGGFWALFCALIIIQAVVIGMFGFGFDLVSSICCGIFVGVEILMVGLIILLTVFKYYDYIGWYLVLGILAICAGAVLAAMVGLNRRSGGRGR